MLTAITNYIDFLEREYGLQISLHGKGFEGYLDTLVQYNAHECAYCMYVKSSDECWNRCKESQKRAEKTAVTGAFFGICYAGVGEFVFPVYAWEKVVGIISVGGYWGSPEKRAQFAAKYGFYEEKLEKLGKISLKFEIPSMKWIKTVVEPLGAMLTVLLEHNERVADVYGKVLSILHTEYAKRLTIGEIAEQCHYSKAFISRRFKEKSGVTVNQYLNNLRMEKARKLLLNSKMKIEDVAAAVGFSDANYFIAFSSKFYGAPPGQFRKNQKTRGEAEESCFNMSP